MEMISKVRDTISKYDMILGGENVLIGLSGGADSVCLLLCLKELGVNISAFHVNHNLRGEESLRDKDFCISLCKRLGVRIYTADIDVTGYCEKNHVSIEEGARELRYKELMSIGADKIATAHNLNDCLETTIFNLARGTGLKGLCSIPPKRDNIIRPLINCTREEIEGFLAEKGQDFVTDSTNLEDQYTRNKIRHKIIPVMLEINSSLFGSYSDTREHLFDIEYHLEEESEKLYYKARLDKNAYSISVLNEIGDALLSRVVNMVLKENSIEISALRIKKIIEIIRNGGKFNICGDIYARSDKGLLVVGRLPKAADDVLFEIKGIPCEMHFFDKTLHIDYKDDFSFTLGCHKQFSGNIIDADKLLGAMVLRNRRNGDKISLAGRGFTSRLKVLFNESVPFEQRSKRAILCDDNGIFYVEGFGIDERVKVDNNTKRIIIIAIS